MTHRVFMVHGMGNPKAGWSKEAVKRLKRFFSDHRTDEDFKLNEDIIEFVEINYNHVFQNSIDLWAERTAEIQALETGFGIPTKNKILGFLENGSDEEFFWTHAMDVVLYYVSEYFREAVNVSVASQIAEKIKESRSGDKWSVIGYSLGTAVVHDTLHKWYTQTFDGSPPLGTMTKPRSVIMISNVSRAIQRDIAVLDTSEGGSTVRPGKGCYFYVDIDNRFDPFSQLRPLDLIGWPNPANQNKVLSLELRNIHDKNTHSLEHYLESNLTCELIWNTLFETNRDSTKTIKPQFESERERYKGIESAAMTEIKELIEKANKDIAKQYEQSISLGLKALFNAWLSKL